MNDKVNLLGLHPSFSELADDSLERLDAAGESRSFAAGDIIFEADGEADRFFVVRSGVVALQMVSPGREPLVVETLGPGELLGVSWAFPPFRWNWTAVAQTDVEAHSFEANLIHDAAHDDSALRAALLEALAIEAIDRLHATRLRLLDIYQGAP